jgi:intracellular sulfur oxidation DsrE/DsrF family protein
MSVRTARLLMLTTAALATAVASGVIPSLATRSAEARQTTARGKDQWLAGLTAPHRQLFDSPTPAGGIPLVHIMNYYDTYNKAYGVADRDIDAVGTFYGATTFYGLNDAMWAKYRLGEFLDAKDAAGAPLTANPWRAAPVILGMSLPAASVESLQKRGATFIVCNNALTIFSGMLAQARGLSPATVYEDMKANILPGVELVPGMVVAVEQAQNAGVAYHRQ